MICRFVLLLCPLALALGQSSTISGTVLDADSGAPLGSARIEIQSQSQQRTEVTPLAVLTKSDGTFQVTNVPPGNYFLYAARTGYVPADLPGKDSAQSVGISTAAVTVEPKLYLRQQAAVEGTVIDEAGVPVPGASVNLLRMYIDEGRRRFEIANGASTDQTGAFRIASLQAGNYVLGVNLMGGPQNEQAFTVLPALFYPKTSDPMRAKILRLAPGATEKASVEIRPVPAFTVRGTVAAGARYPSLILRAKKLAGMPMSREFSAVWNQQAQTFSFAGIPSGIYDVDATIQADGKQLVATETVTVNGKDVSGISLKPEPMKAIEGTLRYDGPSQPPVVLLQLQADRGAVQSQVAPDGKFRFANLRAGRYRLVLPHGGNQRLREVKQDGRNAIADGVLTTGGSLEVVVSNRAGKLTGTISSTGPATVTIFHLDGKELLLERSQ